MMRALTTAGTGMVAQQMNLDVIANNLANVNTNAFKTQRAEFQDLMYQTYRASGAENGGDSKLPSAAQIGLGSRFASNTTNFQPGTVQSTGNPFDVSINGDGFFQIELPDGSTAYTRDGAFKTDANGLLVTSDGYAVKPQTTIPTGVKSITIAPNGTITGILSGTDDPTTVGNIGLVIFPNPSGMTRIGQNLFKAGGASGDPVEAVPGQDGSGSLQQRFLEGSNVQVVEEMVRMITAQRAYEINSKAIQTADEMMGILNGLKR